MTTTTYTEEQTDAIGALLLGHRVDKIADNQLRLDDGTVLTLVGHDGGCACNAGCYDLTELSGVDNVITKVEFAADPGGDDFANSQGTYRIFVFAGHTKVNLATFEGTDGNGWYGTGYSIEVRSPADVAPQSVDVVPTDLAGLVARYGPRDAGPIRARFPIEVGVVIAGEFLDAIAYGKSLGLGVEAHKGGGWLIQRYQVVAAGPWPDLRRFLEVIVELSQEA